MIISLILILAVVFGAIHPVWLVFLLFTWFPDVIFIGAVLELIEVIIKRNKHTQNTRGAKEK
jgi:hypothetical protein